MANGDVWLSEMKILELFENPWHPDDPDKQPHQSVPFFRLWRLVFPDWDRIDHIDHWPSVNEKTWKYISRQFIVFDQKYHPDVVAGGLWMNNGFSSDNSLEDWQVDTSTCTVHYKEES